MSKYKVGDKVRIVSEKDSGYGEMDEWLGTIMTVRGELWHDNYRMEEDMGQWCWNDSMIEGLAIPQQSITAEPPFELKPTESIMLTQQGNTITAQLISGKNVCKEEKAKCNPSDTFDFQVGAKLAFERLMKPEFRPYLTSNFNGAIVGEIGQATSIVDVQGTKLCIGDTVTVYSDCGYHGESPIICKNNYAFVMGLQTVEFKRPITGIFDLIIIKKRSYTEVKHNETVNRIKYIKEKQ